MNAQEQKPALEESLARQNSDLRIEPVEVDKSLDISDPLNHFDLRILPAKE